MSNNLYKRSKHVNFNYCTGNNSLYFRVCNYLSRSFAIPFFSKIPIVSFYPKTIQAIGVLKTLPDKENTPNGILYSSTLKTNAEGFESLREIIQKVYKIPAFDQITFKRTQQFMTGLDQTSNKPIYYGGDCFIELRNADKVRATLYEIDDDFSDIKRELDRIVRKRLAIVAFIFGLAAILVGVLK
jgi:hypothetical protein